MTLPVLLWSALCTGVLSLSTFLVTPGLFVLATLLATVSAACYGALLIWIDRHEREPWWLLGTAFFWGATVATALSYPVNTAVMVAASAVSGDPATGSIVAATMSAPWVEEVAKGLALLLLYIMFRREFDDVLDGLVYGAIVGLGFAWFENIVYYVRFASDHGVEAMFGLAWIRGVLHGLAGHATFTALTGIGFGLVRVGRRGATRWLAVPAALTLAVLAHFAWNLFGSVIIGIVGDDPLAVGLVGVPLAVVLVSGPFVVLVLLTLLLAWRHQDQVLRTWLAQESPDPVPPHLIDEIVPARRRTARSLRLLLSGRLGAWWRHRALTHALVELAFARWHHARDPDVTWPVDEDADVTGYRARVRRGLQGAPGDRRAAQDRPR